MQWWLRQREAASERLHVGCPGYLDAAVVILLADDGLALHLTHQVHLAIPPNHEYGL